MCACASFASLCLNTCWHIYIFWITFSISMYIMCVRLFSALSRRVGALQIAIIIILKRFGPGTLEVFFNISVFISKCSVYCFTSSMLQTPYTCVYAHCICVLHVCGVCCMCVVCVACVWCVLHVCCVPVGANVSRSPLLFYVNFDFGLT